MNDFAPSDSPSNETNAAPAQEATESSGSGFGGIFKIGGFLVIAAIVIGMKFYNKGATSSEVKAQAYAAFADYEDQAQIRRIIDRHHDRCFDEAYSLGGRRRSAKFDEEKYINSMRSAIQADLLAENRGLQDPIQQATYEDESDPSSVPE